jgi:thioredoxin 2
MSAEAMKHHIRCLACGALNRVADQRLQQGLAPVCGKCKSPLPVSTQPVVVTDANFRDEVVRSSLPVLLDLWAAWCGPCRMMEPTINELAAELTGRMRVGKLNIDENPQTAERFNVRGIPTLLVFKDGREVDRIIGVAGGRNTCSLFGRNRSLP